MSRTAPRAHRLLLPVASAVLALSLAGCGSDEAGADAADTGSSAAPSADAGPDTTSDSGADTGSDAGSGTLALTADPSVAGKCAMPSADTLAGFDTAFEGTVTSLADGVATLSVDQWYTDGDAATVTVATPSEALQDLLLAVDFQEGQTYLVSATDDRVSLCGYSGAVSPDLETLYTQAFAG